MSTDNCIQPSAGNMNLKNSTTIKGSEWQLLKCKNITEVLFTITEQNFIRLIKHMPYQKDQSFGYRLIEYNIQEEVK